MFSKCVVFLLVAVFASQCTGLDNSNIIDKITDAIKKLQVKVQEALEKARDNVKHAIATLYEFAHGELNRAKDKITEVIKQALDKLSELNEEAGAVGVDVADCLLGQDDKLTDLNEKNLLSLSQCIDSNVQRADGIADETFNQLNNFLGFVDDDLERLRECDSLKCYLGLAADVTWQAINIPRKVLLIVDHTILTIHGINKDILLCSADTVLQVGIGTTSIVAETTKCVNDAISNKQRIFKIKL